MSELRLFKVVTKRVTIVSYLNKVENWHLWVQIFCVHASTMERALEPKVSLTPASDSLDGEAVATMLSPFTVFVCVLKVGQDR